MTHTKNTKILFWGTPDITLPYLNTLKQAGYTISAIITLPDRPVGRKQIITAPAPKLWAQKYGIPVLQPTHLDKECKEKIKAYNPDISIVVAYGKIIPEEIINLPKLGTVNIHYSLLPRWRGATPVESALLAGDKETGVSIQQMVYELDAGDILAETKIELLGDEFREELRLKLSHLGAKLLLETLPNILDKTIKGRIQDSSLVTKSSLLKKEDGLISLDESSISLWRKWRALYPWPGLFFFDENKKRIKITKACFENGKFIIEKVIPEGKSEMEYRK